MGGGVIGLVIEMFLVYRWRYVNLRVEVGSLARTVV